MTRPIADRDSAPWWAGLAEHHLLLQVCDRCGTRRIAPRALCNACGSFDWQWVQASGAGTIASWTVSHRTYQAERNAPYVIVLVRLVEGPNLMLPGSWSGASDGSDLAVDLPVKLSYEDLAPIDGEAPAALLTWRPAG